MKWSSVNNFCVVVVVVVVKPKQRQKITYLKINKTTKKY